MPPLDLYDVGFVGVAGASAGGDSRSTADSSAMTCGGTNNPWTALSISQFWNGLSWDNSVASLPAVRQFWCAGGNYDNYLGACGDSEGTGNEEKDTFQWNGSAWTAEGGGYPQTNLYHNIGGSFGGNGDAAFIHSGQSGSSYVTTSEIWDGASSTWTTSVSSTYGGQGNTGDGTPDDFIATGGYSLNGTGSAHYTFKSESFNGTSWTGEDDFPTTAAGGTTAGGYGGGAASGRESFMAFSNTTDSAVANVAYYYDGDSWTASASDLADASKYGAGGGDSSSGIFCGGVIPGEPGSTPWGAVTSQLYDGATDVFTATADLDDGFSAGGMGANT